MATKTFKFRAADSFWGHVRKNGRRYNHRERSRNNCPLCEMDDAHIERFVASLQEEGLVADDYDVDMTKDALKEVWQSGAELRTLPIKELGGRTALQALAEL